MEMYKQPKVSNNMRQSQEEHSQETEHHSSKKNHSLVQVEDDKVARSMPIKTVAGSGPQQLGPLTQQEHVVYSHISPKHTNKRPSQ